MAAPLCRPERSGEEATVRDVLSRSFGGSRVAQLADALRASSAWVDGLSYVAEVDDEVVGHLLFTRSLLDTPRRLVDVLVLSPVGVVPEHQGRGVGSALIRHGLSAVAARSEPLVFLEGSPQYYPRFGFEPGARHGFRRPSLRIPEAAFMVRRLPSYEPWMTGTLVYAHPFWDLDCVGLRDPQPVVIETERLILRRLTMADLDDLAALYADPEVRRYFPDGTQSYEQTRGELEWIIDVYYGRYGYGLWATILKETGAFVGRCGLLPWEIGGRTEVEAAFLFDKDYWGRGLATEAARAIVEYAFATLPVERLICMFEPEHGASRRVAAKVGMTLLWDDYVDEHGRSHVYAIQRPRSHAGSAET